MTKIICLFLILGIFTNLAFSQSKMKVKTKSNGSKKFELKREKFDPTRNPNDDLQAAIIKATAKNKRIILDIGGEWCGWCIEMDNYIAKRSKLRKLRDKNFIWVKINFSEENENTEFLSKYPKIVAYPHLFILEKDGSFLHSQDTSQFESGSSYNLQIFADFLKKWSPVK